MPGAGERPMTLWSSVCHHHLLRHIGGCIVSDLTQQNRLHRETTEPQNTSGCDPKSCFWF